MDSINVGAIISGVFGGGVLGVLIRALWESRKVRLEHKLQIMREMTSSFHQLSQYYVDLGQAAFDLKLTIENNSQEEVSFYRFVRFQLEYERLPVVQLKCGLAEYAFDMLAEGIKKLLRNIAQFSDEDFINIKDGVDLNEKLVDFKQRLSEDGWLKNIFIKYKGLLTNSSSELKELMECFSFLMFMETTCGKETWYEENDIYDQAKDGLNHLHKLTHIGDDVKSQVSKYYSYLIDENKPAWYKRIRTRKEV